MKAATNNYCDLETKPSYNPMLIHSAPPPGQAKKQANRELYQRKGNVHLFIPKEGINWPEDAFNLPFGDRNKKIRLMRRGGSANAS